MATSTQEVVTRHAPDGRPLHPLGRAATVLFLALAALIFAPPSGRAAKFDEMSLERWAKLGEADRYQLNIAEKYYRESNWKIAASEYEKFLSLYEKSEGAPYAQLKWSLCQDSLRKVNTAIKDGYQSVIDYWPESPEAMTSAYLIGKAYKEMGDIKQAKKAYAKVVSDHPDQLVAVLAKIDLADVARIEKDDKRRVTLWSEVVYHTNRKGDVIPLCVEASQQMATYYFQQGDFPNAHKALATSFKEADQPYHITFFIRGPLGALVAVADQKARGLKMADLAIAHIRNLIPAEPKDDAQKNQVRQYLYNIAEIEQYAGRSVEWVKTYDEVIKRLGVDDDVLGRKAWALKSSNHRDDARKIYQQFQNPIEGLGQVAYSYREEQKPDSAIPIYEELVAKDSKAPARWQWELANTYRDANKFKEAIAVYRQCDNFPEDLKQMAGCHRRLGEHKEAMALYQQVLGGHPASAPWAMLEMARTLEEANQKDGAIKAFQQVCKRYPKSGEASVAHARLQDGYKINATLGGATDE